jgi:hypothetical protein
MVFFYFDARNAAQVGVVKEVNVLFRKWVFFTKSDETVFLVQNLDLFIGVGVYFDYLFGVVLVDDVLRGGVSWLRIM